MTTLRHAATLLCAATLFGCSAESTSEVLAPDALAPQLEASGGSSGPSASGHGNVIQQPSGAKRTFSFHARVMPDGSVQGEYDNHNRQQGFVNHGDVDCLRLIGTNGAVLSGPVKRTTNPAVLEGSRVIFRVEDNGEGSDDPVDAVDRVSALLIFPPGSTVDCQTFTPPILLPVVGGNVQVKP